MRWQWRSGGESSLWPKATNSICAQVGHLRRQGGNWKPEAVVFCVCTPSARGKRSTNFLTFETHVKMLRFPWCVCWRLGFVRVEKGGNSCENEHFLFFFLGALTAGKNYRLVQMDSKEHWTWAASKQNPAAIAFFVFHKFSLLFFSGKIYFVDWSAQWLICVKPASRTIRVMNGRCAELMVLKGKLCWCDERCILTSSHLNNVKVSFHAGSTRYAAVRNFALCFHVHNTCLSQCQAADNI